MDSRRDRQMKDKGQPTPLICEDFHPSVQWTQDAESRVLRIDLPDFQKEEIKVQVNSSGKLTVSGKRQVSEGRCISLEKVFDVPKDSDLDKISGRFDGRYLSLIMPKKLEKKEETPTNAKKLEAVWKERIEEELMDHGLVDNLLEKINTNRKLITVAVVAFSVGFFVSRKLRSSG